MKKIVSLFVAVCCIVQLRAQTITAAEYFFNADPGPGAGTQISIGAPAAIKTFSANIATTNLSPGFHLLAVRAKDSEEKWGMFEWRTVYISSPASNVGIITAAEFYFDVDPGVGNGTGIGISSPGHVVQFKAVIPVTALQPGFHHLVIRTRDAAGVWGLFESRGFYIGNVQSNVQGIVAAEYYIDDDPGAGNGTPVSIGTGNAVAFTANIPTATLSSGFHTIAIRAKNGDGVWGIIEAKGFYVLTTGTNMAPVVAAEYFLDNDPGVGNGSPITSTSPGNAVSQSVVINIPVNMPNGRHVLVVRTKDANGLWGLFEFTEIDVAGFPLPLNWLSFSAKLVDEKVAVQWKTGNEINTSHFIVERSGNGVDFREIGRVDAKGLSENSYGFDDKNPLNGFNYYRIKQVDKDGRSSYSVITKVYFGDAVANTLRLFPQPAKTTLNIVFAGKGRDVLIQVYDANGRTVMSDRKSYASPLSISTGHLSGGTYWITVSDGLTLQKGQFIKQ